MMLIRMNDGNTVILEDNSAFKRFVGEQISEDAGEVVESLIQKADYTSMKIESDLLSYESTLEENRDAFNDLDTNIGALKDYIIDIKKLNRTYIIQELERLLSIISHQL